MANKLGIVGLMVGFVAFSVPLFAHHGAASFDTTRELNLKGTVTDWIWANPHCFLKFDAKDETGSVRNCRSSSASISALLRTSWH